MNIDKLTHPEEMLSFNMRIYPDDHDRHLKWPFEGDVTINVMDTKAPRSRKLLVKYCQINCNDRSEPFQFKYNELVEAEVLKSDGITIECIIDLL